MAKPLASLSSGLLARPGQAKPAMRPQLFGNPHAEDLGWNDMGQAATYAPAQPAPAPAPTPVQTAQPAPAPVPPVLAERAKLVRAVAKAKPRGKAAASTVPAGRKAAFTLRLDADRHLRLRLASAVNGRSSQQLLVEALDSYLNAQPAVEDLARQVPVTKRAAGEK